MIIINTFILALASMLEIMITVYIWVIIIHSVLSWVSVDYSNPFVQILDRLTAPAYMFVRKYIPTVFSRIDFTPFIIILALQFVNLFVVQLLYASVPH